jgi:hypothetical protein
VCKLISKLTCTRQLKFKRLDIITVKQPSASLKPVIQFGFNEFFGFLILIFVQNCLLFMLFNFNNLNLNNFNLA